VTAAASSICGRRRCLTSSCGCRTRFWFRTPCSRTNCCGFPRRRKTCSWPTLRRGRVAIVALCVTQMALAAMFLVAGGSKLIGAPAMVTLFKRDRLGTMAPLRHRCSRDQRGGSATNSLVVALSRQVRLACSAMMHGALCHDGSTPKITIRLASAAPGQMGDFMPDAIATRCRPFAR
jgi:hypothetical protein